MLSWLQRQDCLNRSNALYDFYDRVMNDFFERLYREYKHKKGLVDEEKISDFQEVRPLPPSASKSTSPRPTPSPSSTAASR